MLEPGPMAPIRPRRPRSRAAPAETGEQSKAKQEGVLSDHRLTLIIFLGDPFFAVRRLSSATDVDSATRASHVLVAAA
jgi:hypothetical protein